MHFASIAAVVPWLIQHGYFLMYLAMVVEGPIVTVAASFAAALGYFHFWAVILLAILGDLTGDIVYYAIGFWGRKKFLDSHGHRIGLPPARVERLEKLLHDHPGKALLLVKFAPILATPGLILAGAGRMPVRKFTAWCALIILPRTLAFALLGYFSGTTLRFATAYLGWGEYAIFAVIVLVVLGYYAIRKLIQVFSEEIEKEEKV